MGERSARGFVIFVYLSKRIFIEPLQFDPKRYEEEKEEKEKNGVTYKFQPWNGLPRSLFLTVCEKNKDWNKKRVNMFT